MPDRCKKLQRKRKVDPAKKSAYKKSCLDKKSFGCSDEDYKECLKKYREKFPPDELDLKICENECKVSDDPSKCLTQCSIDYPMDKFEKSDPCEGIKKPSTEDDFDDKFKEGMGVLIRREFTIKRPVPIFSIGEKVKYKKIVGEVEVEVEGKIIKVNVDDNVPDGNNTIQTESQSNIRNEVKRIVGILSNSDSNKNTLISTLISRSKSREEKNEIIEKLHSNNIVSKQEENITSDLIKEKRESILKETAYSTEEDKKTEYIEYERDKFFKITNPSANEENIYIAWGKKEKKLLDDYNKTGNTYIDYKINKWKEEEKEKIKSEYVYSIVNKIESVLYKSSYTITYDILYKGKNDNFFDNNGEIDNIDQKDINVPTTTVTDDINVPTTTVTDDITKRDQYEVESVDKELKIVPISDIDGLGTKPSTFQKGEKVYLYECGVIDRVNKNEHDIDVNIVNEQFGKKSNKKSTVGVDMNDAIPYFKKGDNVQFDNGDNVQFEVKSVVTDYIEIERKTNVKLDKRLIPINKENSFKNSEIKFKKYKIKHYKPDKSVSNRIFNKLKTPFTLVAKTISETARFLKPYGEFVMEEGRAIKDETAADLYDAMGTKKGNDCKTSTKKYVGLLDIDLPLPYSIKPSFIRNLSVSQKEALYKKFKKEYEREGIENEHIRSLKPFSKKFWAMYNKNTTKNKVSLKEMDKVHNELIKLKKCGCLKENAPIDKCKYLNKTLKYFQSKKIENDTKKIENDKTNSTELKGGNLLDVVGAFATAATSSSPYAPSSPPASAKDSTPDPDDDSSPNVPNGPVMKKILKVKKVQKPATDNETSKPLLDADGNPKTALVENEKNKKKITDLLESSIPGENVNESNFKERFVKKLSERLDSKRSDLYKERVMVMKGEVADGKDIKWYHWNYIKTIPLRLRLFWALRWGQIITIALLYVSFKIYHKNKNLTFLVILLLCTNVFYEMYTGTSNTLFKFLVFTILSIFILIILQGVLHILGKNSECSSISLEENENLTAYQNDLYLFSIMGIVLFLISIRGLCNFVPWLNFDWILYKIGFFLYFIQTSVSYNGTALSSPIGNVGSTFFILCSFNALYQYLYFPDTKGDEFKLKNLSRFGDVLQTEYYMSQLPSLKNE